LKILISKRNATVTASIWKFLYMNKLRILDYRLVLDVPISYPTNYLLIFAHNLNQ
jgi:hypothetical protein